MIAGAVLLARAGPVTATCPTVSAGADVLAGALEPHRALRQELGVALPDAPTLLLIYSEGGHFPNT